jgi:hypothetical protein
MATGILVQYSISGDLLRGKGSKQMLLAYSKQGIVT